MSFIFFLCVGIVAGAKLAEGTVIATWTAMVFALLGMLEAESTYLMIACSVYGVLDMWGGPSTWVVFVLWGMAVCLPTYVVPSLMAMSHRPIAPVLV